ncbi:MAG: ferredoxin oxidoreductase [Desulfobulbus propionicus]|nr:MAG: ferredoxin oxidoreductase [Desulfobulbus propionicus]
MKHLERTNDFVIRFANVNGSGSASANNLFAKAVFRMGVPVSPKNIFPSNIQGLPTWYEVRISEQGYLGRHGKVHMVVAMNGQTMTRDYHSLEPGGYFLYDASRRLPEEFNRDDVEVIGIPLTLLCNDAFAEPKMRGLLKNIIYVGALAYLLDMEFEVFTSSIEKQFRKKSALIAPNLKALEIGYEYAKKHFATTCKLSVQRRNKIKDAIIMDGNAATALGALYAGATVVGWYPITPSTSVIEYFGRYAEQFRRDADDRLKAAIVQAEDELAALGIVIGASWNGARAFTATSGAGVSLMTEFLGLAYFAEIPAVIVNVQRTGPSTGMPTRTQQSDILSSAYASHGDTRHVLLFPATPKECFELTAEAFDLSEQLQTPVMVLSDLDLGMNSHMCPPLTWDDTRNYNRGKVLDAEQLHALTERWGRYLDVDGDGVGYRTYPGVDPEKGAYFTRGTSHDPYSGYTEDSASYEDNMNRLALKWQTAKNLVPKAEITAHDDSVALIYFGTSTEATREAADLLRAAGINSSLLRIRAFPFHKEIKDIIERHEHIFVVEQNRDAQMRTLLINELEISPQRLIPVLHFDGMPITATYIAEKIMQHTQAATNSLAEDGGAQ